MTGFQAPDEHPTPVQLLAIALAVAVVTMLRPIVGPFAGQGLLYVAINAVAAWRIGPRTALLTAVLGFAASQLLRFLATPAELLHPSTFVTTQYLFGVGSYVVLSAIALMVGRRHRLTVDQLASTQAARVEDDRLHRDALEAALARERSARLEAERANQVREQLLGRLSDELQRASELAAIVEGSQDAILGVDLSSRIVAWNRAAEALFGYSAADAIGRSVEMLLPADRADEERHVMARIRKGETVRHFETARLRRDGTSVPISLTVSPIRNSAGDVTGASKIARDISERRRAEAAVADLQTRLVALTAASSALLHSPQVEDVVPAILAVARDLLPADAYAVWRREPATGRWRIEAHEGTSRRFVEDGVPDRVDAVVDRPMAVTDIAAVPMLDDRRRAYEQEGICSLLVVPLHTSTGMTGTTVFYYRAPRTFSETELLAAQAFANLASAALTTATAYQEATRANRLKDEFLATLSHELRTPLNAVLGYARMVNAGILEGERLTRALGALERNASSLTRLVEDVLDVSRFMTGKVQLNLQAVDLAAVVEQAIVSLRPAAEVKGVRLSPGPGGAAAALVHGDPDRLQQVSWNLISNAIKFTPRGGTVEVEIVGCDGFVEVVVRDTGIGIAPAFMPHVFDRFRQGDGSLVREHGGLGLGLAIARDLVQLHGGSIAASSGGVGLGATFRVRLPLMAASAVTALDQSAAISSAGKGERTSAAGVLPAGDGQ